MISTEFLLEFWGRGLLPASHGISGQQVQCRKNPPSYFSVPGGPLLAPDIWPGHTFSILKHSICSVRRGLRLSLFLSLTTNKKEAAVGRHTDTRTPAGSLPTWDGIGPFHGLPHSQTQIRQGASHPPCSLSGRMGKEVQNCFLLFG